MIYSSTDVQSRKNEMLQMFNSVNCTVNSMEDKVTAVTKVLSSIHDNITDIMKRPVPSGVVGSIQIPLGRRLKSKLPRGNYLAVMTATFLI